MSSSNISLIFPLADAQRNPKSGNKAGNLSKLIAARFVVPRGFVISADAYRSHLWASGVRNSVSSTMDAQDRANLRAAIINSEIPQDIWNMISESYERLSWQIGVSDPKVVVRPSAVEENSRGKAFPGAYESHLYVGGLSALGDAIKHTWASLWSENAAECRKEFGITSEPAMAVIVQQMVDANWNGRISTVDRSTGNPYEASLRCVSNGESVFYKINLLDMTSACNSPDSEISLDDDVVLTIAEKAVLIENEIGAPVEVSWAYDGEILWILQAKHLLNIPVFFPVKWTKKNDEKARWNLISSKPICHFSRSHLWDAYRDPIRQFPGSANYVKNLVINGFVYRQKTKRPDKGRVSAKENSAGNALLAEMERVMEPDLRTRAEEIMRSELNLMDHQHLLRTLAASSEVAYYSLQYMNSACFPAARFSESLKGLLNDADANGSMYRRLISGLDETTYTRDARLQELAQKLAEAKAEEKLASELWWNDFKAEVAEFALKYGYSFKNTGEMYDIAAWKSWNEDNEAVLRIIGAISLCDKHNAIKSRREEAKKVFSDAEKEAESLFKGQSVNQFKKNLYLLRHWLVRFVECEHIYALSCCALRRVLLEFASRLYKSGAIAGEDEIFYLKLDELLELPCELSQDEKSTIASNIARRKHEYWLERRYSAPEVLSNEELKANSEVCPTGILSGEAISSGLSSGRVRIVNSIEEAGELEPGEILVVKSLSLTWTPFFAAAAGCVAENSCIGLPVSECGIPIVAGCNNVVETLRNGQKITVTGSDGTVDLNIISDEIGTLDEP